MIGRAFVVGSLFVACGTPKDSAGWCGTCPSGSPSDPALEARRTFWREAAAVTGSVPEGRTAAEWARELDLWLASTDPELRDDLANTILSGWIVRGAIEDDPLRDLATKWRTDLARPGASDEDVLARSFAALTLATAVAWDLKHPFLGGELARIRAAALEYAAREHDVRGYDDRLGWVHATAHTADLLKFLARGPELSTSEQAAFLGAIEGKCGTEGSTWSAGEDLRLARVVLSLVNRTDFDVSGFEAWIVRYETAFRDLWAGPRIEARRLAEFGNRRRILVELHAILPVDGAIEERHVVARDRVLQALRATG